MDITTILLAMGVLAFCFICFGVGVIFFGKTANRDACGTVPTPKNEDCPSQKAGLCPGEDLTGTVKLAKRAQISFHRH